MDLSALAGVGVFRLWLEPGAFERAHITEHRAIAWSDDVELCADTLYLRLTGRPANTASVISSQRMPEIRASQAALSAKPCYST